jgi:predicted TIM-barrel fold metal-dependent hydrolase
MALTALARLPNVALKISGLGDLDEARRRQAILAAIEAFGPDRAMFASNYPVDSLRMSFTDIFRGFEEATRELSVDERRALFHDNALRIYRMEQPWQPNPSRSAT